jgi:hypothetical protein
MLRYLAKSLWPLGLADSGFYEFAFIGERKIDALWTNVSCRPASWHSTTLRE